MIFAIAVTEKFMKRVLKRILKRNIYSVVYDSEVLENS